MTAIPVKPKRRSLLRLFGLYITLPLTLILLGVSYNLRRSHQNEAHREDLTKGLGSLSAAAGLYAQEHGNRLPSADDWEQALQPNTGPIPLDLPPMSGGHGKRIAMNRALAGRALNTISQPRQAILFYESTSSARNACDDLTTLVPPGDPSPLIFGFADGHIEEIVPASRREEALTRSRQASLPPATASKP